MIRSKLVFIVFVVLLLGCGDELKEGYNSEIDEAWDGFETLNYLQEGGNILGEGEAIEGLLKTTTTGLPKNINLVNFDLVPEDNYVRIISELRYDLRRLRKIEVEVRFPEDTKVKMMSMIEEYAYSTPGGDSPGDYDNTKSPSEGGPYAFVEVNYRRYIVFDNFTVKINGTRQYHEDPEVSDFMFWDATTGTQNSVARILTQGSFTGGVGIFTRVVSLTDGKIATLSKSYSEDGSGKVSGAISGNSIEGVVMRGSFQIETANTPCILDDTGSMQQVVYYPSTHLSGRKTETIDFTISVNGVYDGNFTLENLDGSILNKTLHRVFTRPSGCDVRNIRQTANLTGTDYSGSSLEISEVKAREFTHIYGVARTADGSSSNIDFYRVSGQAVYR